MRHPTNNEKIRIVKSPNTPRSPYLNTSKLTKYSKYSNFSYRKKFHNFIAYFVIISHL